MGIVKKIKKSIYKKVKNRKTSKTNASIINIWRNDTSNIGDLVCAPSLYFNELQKNSISIDIMDFTNYIDLQNKTIIVGGGGLLLPYFEKAINNILKIADKNNIVFWGVGFDNYIKDDFFIDLNTSNLKNIATRDFFLNDKYDYVPCSSCMSKLFDKYINNKATAEYGLYLHGDYSKPIHNDLKNIPCLYNTNVRSFDEALNFLSNHNIILTNSFHGLYWATLLGKKVIVLPWIDKDGSKGFSHKFKSFKYKPYFLEDWNDYLNLTKLKQYKNSLKECREINKNFLETIKNIL